MSDQDSTAEKEQTGTSDTVTDSPPQADARGSVKKGSQIIAIVIVLSLGWYLLADRFTPYTSQARVQGYVVGVAPKVAGVVTQVWVTNNQAVEQGRRLFEIDPSQYRIALEKTQSDLESARRQVDAGTAAVDSARANLRSALAYELKAQQDVTRLQRLYQDDPGTISVRRLEVSQATLDQAKAKVTAAKAEIQRAIEQKGGEDEGNNAILKAALSAVDKAELDLNNTVVTASSRGVITDLRADVGRYAAIGSPVMTLIAVNDLWISAEFTENNLGHIQEGTRVEILFDSLPGQIFVGKLRSIGLGVSIGEGQTPGTLPTIENNRDWLRQSQRFPIIIDFDTGQQEFLRQLRVGGQASVIAYSEGHGILELLGKLYIRLMSILSYAY